MGGLVKVLPFLSIITMFGVLTISGVPPFASFNSELAGIMGMLKIITDADGSVLRFITIGCVVLIALMSVFAFVSFVRLYSIVFSGRPRDLDLKVRVESHLSENASYVFFVVAIFVVSLFPGLFSHIASTIIGGSSTVPLIQLQIGDFEFIPAYLILVYALLGVIVYALSRFFLGSLTKAVPWNCGYPTIPHRSQYSSRSLVQPIRRLYEGLYMQASDLSYNEYYKKDRNTLKFLKRKAYFTNIGYLKCIRGIQYL